jgi:hypothetical protein
MHAPVRVPGRLLGDGSLALRLGDGGGALPLAHDLVGGHALGPRPRLRGVREGQPRRVDDAVVPDQRDGDLGGLAHPQPLAPELGDVGHHAQHGLLAAVHRLGLDVAEPDLEGRREVVAGQLQHGHFAAAVQVQAVHDGDGSDRRPHGAHAFVELVLGLVGGDDGPARAVVDHLFVGLFGARSGLELDYSLLRQAQVHAFGVFHVEGALVQLRHGVVGFQQGLLLVHLEQTSLNRAPTRRNPICPDRPITMRQSHAKNQKSIQIFKSRKLHRLGLFTSQV